MSEETPSVGRRGRLRRQLELEAVLAELAATPRRLAQLVAEASDALLDAASPGEWSARDVLAHLRDLEVLVFRWGLVQAMLEEEATVPVFDQGAWAERRWRGRDQKQQLLGDFALQRQATLNLLAKFAPAHWERRARIPGGRVVTMREWVAGMVAHDGEHVTQLEGLLGYTHQQAMERRRRWAEEWRQ